MGHPRRAFVAIAAAVGLLAVGQSIPAAADAGFVDAIAQGSTTARTSIVISRPAGTVAGQVMVASVVMSNDDPTFTAPAGWTLVRQDKIKDVLRQAVYVRVAGAEEPASYTWRVSSTRRMAGGIATFSGIDTTNPVDAASGSANSSSTAVPAPGVTTTVPNMVLVQLSAAASLGGLAPAAGMTEAWEAAAPGSSTSKNQKGAVASLSYAVQPAAGPTGGRTATVSSAGKSIGALVALRPAPGPDFGPPDTSIDSGPSGTTTNSFATFTFSATEPASFLCQFDGGAAEPCTSPRTYVTLAAGGHAFSVWATDTAGNVDLSPATRSWTVFPGTDDPVLVGAGDSGYCGSDNDEATAQLLDAIPGTVVALGDNAYIDATLGEYNDCYGPTWGRHKDRTIPVPGNHEYQASATADGYFDYFGAAAGDPTKGWYDYRLGAWHVIVLNSGTCVLTGGCEAGSEQEQWLRRVLATSTAECTVAMIHHPRFSSSSAHGSYPEMAPFWDALYQYGADVVLTGHDHLYERFGMQSPDGRADAVSGIRQFIVGTGGRSQYSFATPQPNSEVRARSYGVLKMTLHDTSYDWEFVPVAGQTFTDSGTAACHDAPPVQPAPPVEPVLPPPSPSTVGAGVTLIGSTSDGSSASRTSISLPRPAGSAAGDVLVATVATNYDATIVPVEPGWTVVRNDVLDQAVRQAVFVRVVGPADPASYQWKTPEGLRRTTGGLSAYAGVNTTQPVDGSGAALNPSGTAISAPSITTTTNNTMLLQIVSVRAEGTVSAPAGMTEVWEAASPNTTAGNVRDVLSSAFEALQPASGPTGARVATSTQAGPGIGVSLALRPA